MDNVQATYRLPALAAGFANWERTELTALRGLARPDSLFPAGNLTMAVTAAAIHQLARDNRLKLEDPVHRYLDKFRKRDPAITIRMLLNHTSGLPYEPPTGHQYSPSKATLSEISNSIAEVLPAYVPGTRTKHSNAAYAVLGHLIATLTRQSYESAVRSLVLQPAGMNRSRFVTEPSAALLTGMIRTVDGRDVSPPGFAPANLPAFGLLTTLEDLLALGRHAIRFPDWDAAEWESDHAGFAAILHLNRQTREVSAAFTNRQGLTPLLKDLLQGRPTRPNLPALAPEFNSNSRPPAVISAEWTQGIGEYGWEHTRVYFHERAGQPHALVNWFSLQAITVDGRQFRIADQGPFAGETVELSAEGVRIGQVLFPKLPPPNRDFRIVMQKSLAELQAIAATATPPAQEGNFRPQQLIDLTTLSPRIRLDIRYATHNNFMGAPLYSQAAAWLQSPAAKALDRALGRLVPQGYGLLIHDAYRPWAVTKMFWEATPEAQRNFVANPAKGSRHNRGCAVDLSLYDLKTGEPVEMVSGFDEFSDRAYPDYPGGTSRQRWYRHLLRSAMEAEGFTVNSDEWWHYDHATWREFPVLNVSFESLSPR